MMSLQTLEDLETEDFQTFLEEDENSITDIILKVNGAEIDVDYDETDAGGLVRAFEETVDSYVAEYRTGKKDDGREYYSLTLYGTRILDTPIEHYLGIETDANADHFRLELLGDYGSDAVTLLELQDEE